MVNDNTSHLVEVEVFQATQSRNEIYHLVKLITITPWAIVVIVQNWIVVGDDGKW